MQSNEIKLGMVRWKRSPKKIIAVKLIGIHLKFSHAAQILVPGKGKMMVLTSEIIEMNPLLEESLKLKQARLNQPRATLKEAQDQAERVRKETT